MPLSLRPATPAAVRRHAIPLVIAVVFLLLPFWWLSGAAVLGGDDTRLYFVYPWQWLQHIAIPAFGGLSGFGGYVPAQQYIPFTLILAVVHSGAPWLNLEALAFGVALSSGFLGVYTTVLLLVTYDASPYRSSAAALAGLLYVTAPLMAAMYWVVPLAWVVGIGGAPLLLALSVAYLRDGQLRWLALLFAVSAYSAAGLAAVPVGLPYAVGAVVTAFLVLLGATGRLWQNVRRPLALVLVVIGANAFWWLPLAVSAVTPGSFGNDALLAGSSAAETVRAVAHGQSILDTLLLLPSGEFERAYGWPSVQLWGWAQTFMLLSICLPAVVLAALLLTRTGGRYWRPLLVAFLLTSVALAYGQTVNISHAGVDLFAFLSSHLPGFAMFRNFYNKFAGAFIFFYVVLIGISTALVLSRFKTLYRWIMILILFAAAILQGVPMLLGKPLYLPISSPKGMTDYGEVGTFPASFLAEMDRLSKVDPSERVLELPLSANYWSEVPLEQSGMVYIGSSPVKILSGVDTFNSLDSFAVAGLPELQARLDQAVSRHDYVSLGAILRLCGIRYLSYTTVIPKAVSSNWLRQPPFPRDTAEMARVASALGATKVATFGQGSATRLLYALPENRVLPRLFVTDRAGVVATRQDLLDTLFGGRSPQRLSDAAGGLGPIIGANLAGDHKGDVVVGTPDGSASVRYAHPQPWRYQMDVRTSRPSLVVLLEPATADWSARISGPGIVGNAPAQKITVDGYATAWLLPAAGEYTLDISYGPQVVTWIAGAASLLTLLALAVLVAWKRWPRVVRLRRPAGRSAVGRREEATPDLASVGRMN